MTRAMPAFLLVLWLFPPVFAQDDDSNNCHDPAARTDWQERVNTHPEDQEVQVLHALWMGLCFKVEAGGNPPPGPPSFFLKTPHTLVPSHHGTQRSYEDPAPPAGTGPGESVASALSSA